MEEVIHDNLESLFAGMLDFYKLSKNPGIIERGVVQADDPTKLQIGWVVFFIENDIEISKRFLISMDDLRNNSVISDSDLDKSLSNYITKSMGGRELIRRMVVES